MHTRTVVKARHALITPDGHVPSAFPGWSGVTANVLISPAIGAGFSQFLLTFVETDGIARFEADANEHVVYVETGDAKATWSGGSTTLTSGGFLFTPPGAALELNAGPGTKLTVYRKIYQKSTDFDPPAALFGNAASVPGEPFLGNPRARLKTLLPIEPQFDIAVNIFTYQPGATLPFVETHIMEHGLLMLEGQGVYRLEDCYYPVEAGDAIWMAPYCPQWFAAIGDVPASYLYHKDIHRLP